MYIVIELLMIFSQLGFNDNDPLMSQTGVYV